MRSSNILEKQFPWQEAFPAKVGHGPSRGSDDHLPGTYPETAALNDPLVMESNSPPFGSRYLDLRSDRAFKYVFGKIAHSGLLVDLLNSLLGGRRTINSLNYGAVERHGGTKGVRAVQYDLQFASDTGWEYLIEMQREGEEGFFRRLLYYSMRLGSEQIPAGKAGDHYPLPPICAVAIVNNNPWKALMDTVRMDDPAYLNAFSLENMKWGFPYPASLELIVVELPKFNKSLDELTTPLDKWLFLLKNLSHLNGQPSVFDGPVFDKLFQLTDLTNLSGKDKQMIIDHERDLRNKLRRYHQEGRQEGIQEGLMDGKLIAVRALISSTDLSDPEIAALAEVDEEVVQRTRTTLSGSA